MRCANSEFRDRFIRHKYTTFNEISKLNLPSSDRNIPDKLNVIYCVRGAVSPLLANIMLDQLDKHLKSKGHRFIRYADDFSIYARTKTEARKIGNEVYLFLRDKLDLPINREKSHRGTAVFAGQRILSSWVMGLYLPTAKERKVNINWL